MRFLGSRPKSRDCIGCSHSEIIVAVYAYGRAKPGKPAENIICSLGCENSYSIAKTQPVSTCIYSRIIYRLQVFKLCAGCILAAQFHYQPVRFRIFRHFNSHPAHGIAVFFQFFADMEVGYGHYKMDGVHVAIYCGINILFADAAVAAYFRIQAFGCYFLNRCALTIRGNG